MRIVCAYAHNENMYFAMTFQIGIQAFTLWIIIDLYDQETNNSILLLYASMLCIISNVYYLSLSSVPA
jgi:hypothetical protein